MKEKKLFNRNFVLIVVGQVISLLGNAILSFAFPLYLLELTGSGTIFGAVMAVSIIPTILLSPIGGMIADRVNRRNIMVVLDFFTCAVIWLSSFFIKEMTIPCVAITLILFSIIRSFYQPAVQASVPSIIANENLLRANSIVNMINSVSMLVGPILGGILYGFYGIIPIIIIGGIAFFISAVMELFINMPFTKKPLTSHIITTVKQDFSESIHFITKEKPIIAKIIVIATLMNMFLTSQLTIGVPYIVNIVLKLDSELLGLSQSAIGIGALLGGISVGIFSNKLKFSIYHRLLFCASISIIPIGVVMLIPVSSMVAFWVIIISIMSVMIFASMFSIAVVTFVQRVIPTEITGKVMAFVTTTTMCATPIGQALYGYLFGNITEYIYLIVFISSAILVVIALMSKKIFMSNS